jgi:hypothetical protein
MGLFTRNETRRIWGLVQKHAPAVTDLVASRAFGSAASAAFYALRSILDRFNVRNTAVLPFPQEGPGES